MLLYNVVHYNNNLEEVPNKTGGVFIQLSKCQWRGVRGYDIEGYVEDISNWSLGDILSNSYQGYNREKNQESIGIDVDINFQPLFLFVTSIDVEKSQVTLESVVGGGDFALPPMANAKLTFDKRLTATNRSILASKIDIGTDNPRNGTNRVPRGVTSTPNVNAINTFFNSYTNDIGTDEVQTALLKFNDTTIPRWSDNASMSGAVQQYSVEFPHDIFYEVIGKDGYEEISNTSHDSPVTHIRAWKWTDSNKNTVYIADTFIDINGDTRSPAVLTAQNPAEIYGKGLTFAYNIRALYGTSIIMELTDEAIMTCQSTMLVPQLKSTRTTRQAYKVPRVLNNSYVQHVDNQQIIVTEVDYLEKISVLGAYGII